MKTFEENLAENLLRFRKEKGFRSRQAFAERAGIPFPTYRDAEEGKSWPERKTLDAIAQALGVQLIELFQAPRPPRARTDSENLLIGEIVGLVSSFDETQLKFLRMAAKALNRSPKAPVVEILDHLKKETD